MEEQSVAVKGNTTVSVTLKSSNSTLSDVVVTALGIPKQRKAISYAVTEIKGENLTKAGADNLGSALQGKVAGLQITNTSGGPMGGTRINLRGINTLDGTQRPLIVIDGIPYNDDEDGYANRGFAQGMKGSAINNINPDDIESISVLKGANAAALYGSQAMGGVLLIVTKKGKAGKGLGVDISSDYVVNKLAYLPGHQNEFGNGSLPYFTSFNAQGVPIWIPLLLPIILAQNWTERWCNGGTDR
ncbi:MAG: TonB-dependent receptor plug domain-containing protein [Ferruginibacter sp.]